MIHKKLDFFRDEILPILKNNIKQREYYEDIK